MIIHIDDRYTVGDIQERFQKCFPLLKIEFYRTSHTWKKHSSLHDIIDPIDTIGSIRKTHEPGILDIKSWYQTGQVEREFKERFGLNVQIYRKRKGGWVQTISTDNLTLKEQSELASRSAGNHNMTNIA
jgi:hypothetical protein